MGILGIRVEDPANLEQAISRALTHRGPALLDVMTNPQELAMPPKIAFEQAYGFSLFMLKGCARRAWQRGRPACQDESFPVIALQILPEPPCIRPRE